MSVWSIAREGRRKAAAERAAAEAEARLRSQELGRRLAAERAAAQAEAEAAARAEDARRYEAMSPLERELEDDFRARTVRWAAERAAEAAKPKPKVPAMSIAMSPEHAAAVRSAEGAATAAQDALARAQAVADARIAEAVRSAPQDRVGQAAARAEAEVAAARMIADAEERAGLAARNLDAARIEATTAAKAASAAVESARARAAAAEAEAASDPLRAGNPFADPVRPRITMSQWRSLSPAKQAQAAREADLVDDPEPVKLSAAETRSVVGPGRRVVTREEFRTIPHVEHAAFFKDGGILVD